MGVLGQQWLYRLWQTPQNIDSLLRHFSVVVRGACAGLVLLRCWNVANKIWQSHTAPVVGRVAQWIRRLTTDQAILGSSPGTVGYTQLFCFRFLSRSSFRNVFSSSWGWWNVFFFYSTIPYFESTVPGRSCDFFTPLLSSRFSFLCFLELFSSSLFFSF